MKIQMQSVHGPRALKSNFVLLSLVCSLHSGVGCSKSSCSSFITAGGGTDLKNRPFSRVVESFQLLLFSMLSFVFKVKWQPIHPKPK